MTSRETAPKGVEKKIAKQPVKAIKEKFVAAKEKAKAKKEEKKASHAERKEKYSPGGSTSKRTNAVADARDTKNDGNAQLED